MECGVSFDAWIPCRQHERAALGVNMTVPYGSWLGRTIGDAFYAPHDVLDAPQDFLASNETLSTPTTAREIVAPDAVLQLR